jgi:hypothetical protein
LGALLAVAGSPAITGRVTPMRWHLGDSNGMALAYTHALRANKIKRISESGQFHS